jgi:DNA-binding NarL/FixJ family response regulator
LKNSTGENLRNAIEAVSRGEQHLGSGFACQIHSGPRLGPGARSTGGRSKSMLTDRERAVLRLIALGFTSKEIAAKLGLTTKSIETYKTRASAKLDLRSRPKIIQYAILQGWFQESA